MYRGQLKVWNGEKGFGFIQSDELSQETFIHISTLKAMSRHPIRGDFIYFAIAKKANGKVRAINCRIEGVAAKSLIKRSPRHYKRSSAVKNKKAMVLVILMISIFTYQRLDISPVSKQPQLTTAKPNSSLANKVQNQPKGQAHFKCDGRQHCSQMTSRAEAEFFTRQCANTKMDGDNDGIPCENDSRF